MTNSAHKIKHRDKPNDVFITPLDLAKEHIKLTAEDHEIYTWYDPFRNSGNYYNNFIGSKKDWAEILDDRDFFSYKPQGDNLIICSNPPYSIMDKVYERCIELNVVKISLLVAVHSITPRRLERLSEAGYNLSFIKIMKVFKWYGMSAIVIFEKDKTPVISYSRKVYR